MSRQARTIITAYEVLDDRTALYAAEAHYCFTGLQDAIGKLAGVLVLFEFNSTTRSLGSAASLEGVGSAMESINDRYRSLRPTERAGHFHSHLTQAWHHVTNSVQEIRRLVVGKSAFDPLPELRRAWSELAKASRILPGFEIVDFGQACCSQHLKI